MQNLIGKVCYFWDNDTGDSCFGILADASNGLFRAKYRGIFENCRKATEQEIYLFWKIYNI